MLGDRRRHDDYLAHAAACEARIGGTRDPRLRALYTDLVRQWRSLAALAIGPPDGIAGAASAPPRRAVQPSDQDARRDIRATPTARR